MPAEAHESSKLLELAMPRCDGRRVLPPRPGRISRGPRIGDAIGSRHALAYSPGAISVSGGEHGADARAPWCITTRSRRRGHGNPRVGAHPWKRPWPEPGKQLHASPSWNRTSIGNSDRSGQRQRQRQQHVAAYGIPYKRFPLDAGEPTRQGTDGHDLDCRHKDSETRRTYGPAHNGRTATNKGLNARAL